MGQYSTVIAVWCLTFKNARAFNHVASGARVDGGCGPGRLIRLRARAIVRTGTFYVP
jgi:hypothetical protein